MENLEITKTLDCRGLSCPMPLLKLKKALGSMQTGEVLEMIGNDPGTKNDIEKAVTKVGNEYLGSEEGDGATKFYIRKG